jgi:hypothetical protein
MERARARAQAVTMRRQVRVSGHVPDGRGGQRVVFAAIQVPSEPLNAETTRHFQNLAVKRFREKHPEAGPLIRCRTICYTEDR